MSADNLCLDCGLCCNGGVLTTIELLPGERRFDFGRDEEGNLKAIIELPCPMWNGSCTVYDSRPIACREYKCSMLRNYEAGTYSYDECVAMIAAERG